MDPGINDVPVPDAEDAVTDAAPVPAEEAAVPAAPAAEEKHEEVTATTEVAAAPAAEKEEFVSLYNSVWTTFAAVALGILIVGGIQVAVARIFARERNPHRALTQFVTAMVAIMVGVYVSDMLIAGPNVELLGEGERASILGFVKDTALMIFAYYFGTQSAGSKESDS